MAEAIDAIYPGVKFWVGPPSKNGGFYYDIDLGEDQVISEKDFTTIEQKMKELAKQRNEFVRKELPKAEATKHFTEKGDEYKLDLLEGLEDGNITFYTQGEFTDLCRGPHIPHTGHIKAIKLLNIAGAYWRGDENNKQLTRIYGVSFPKQAELDEHLHLLEEAKKRDHRKLGKELELFMFSKSVGSGLPMWLPKGTIIRTELENFLKKEQTKRGYQSVITPHIGNIELYKTSGHYDKYDEINEYQS
jgi:threonyl-tRNA synthetase